MMKDKTQQSISLTDTSNNASIDKKKNNISQIAFRENSKYAPLRNKIEWSFNYEVNNIRFDSQNRNKIYFIKDKSDQTC